MQVDFGSGYTRNAPRLILREVQLEHGQAAVDGLIHEMYLQIQFGPQPGIDFSGLV